MAGWNSIYIHPYLKYFHMKQYQIGNKIVSRSTYMRHKNDTLESQNDTLQIKNDTPTVSNDTLDDTLETSLRDVSPLTRKEYESWAKTNEHTFTPNWYTAGFESRKEALGSLTTI